MPTGAGPSIWDTFSHTPGRTADGERATSPATTTTAGASDLDLMAELGLRAYRFSVSWPRVQPTGAGRRTPGLDFYDRLVDGLLERGIEPWVTLYHWDLPQPLEDAAAGWTGRRGPLRRVRRSLVERLGDRVSTGSR